MGRVELDLNLHVFGDGIQRRTHLIDQHLTRLAQRIDVGVVAVAVVRELLHQMVVVVAGPEAQRRERHTGLAFFFGEILQRLEVDRTDVEVTVGCEDDPVDPVFDERLLRGGVRQLNARAAVG